MYKKEITPRPTTTVSEVRNQRRQITQPVDLLDTVTATAVILATRQENVDLLPLYNVHGNRKLGTARSTIQENLYEWSQSEEGRQWASRKSALWGPRAEVGAELERGES